VSDNTVFIFYNLGMNYLHNEAPIKVIHRDLKSKNGKIVCVS